MPGSFEAAVLSASVPESGFSISPLISYEFCHEMPKRNHETAEILCKKYLPFFKYKPRKVLYTDFKNQQNNKTGDSPKYSRLLLTNSLPQGGCNDD